MSDIHNPAKKVDESWKDEVKKENEGGSKPAAATQGATEPSKAEQTVSFPLFLSTLGMQAYIALGLLEDPISKAKNVNLPQAKYMIDMIDMIQEKTKGNLSKEEEAMVSGLLYELKMKYMESSKPTE